MKEIIRYAEEALRNKTRAFLEKASDDLLEKIILRDPEAAWEYARHLKQQKHGYRSNAGFRWEQGEDIISTSPQYSYMYAHTVLCGRFELGEAAIARSAEYSFDYALQVIRGRWEPGEEAVSKHAGFSYRYAVEVLGHYEHHRSPRFPLGEEAISKEAQYSYEYARDVIQGRWEPGEEAISECTEVMYDYAKDVCKGRLPDHLHNKMVMLSYSEPDEFVSKYCGAKKYMIKRRKRDS